MCSEAAATRPHPPRLAHLERTAGEQGQRGEWEQATGSTSPVWLVSSSYHYPPCPRQTLPVRWKLPGRGTRHRPPAPSRSPAGPPRSWAGKGRAAAVSRDLPARPAAPIPPTLPPPAPAQRWQHPSFHPTQTPENFFFFFFGSKQPSKGFKRLRARSAEDNANISGAEESSQHNGLEREEVQPKGWDSPPCPCGECQGLLMHALSRQGLGAGCVG